MSSQQQRKRLERTAITKQRPEESPAVQWFDWLGQFQIRKYASLLTLLFCLYVRWTVGLNKYSGFDAPPMYGDYEAQRHWMELTLHIPIKQWYYYDLDWWGLDYPPLTAYVSWICGKIGSFFNPDWFALDVSRGYESLESKMFMRSTVVFFEYVIYVPGIFVFVNWWFNDASRKKKDLATLLILLQPALILIDHGHFQYNSVMLGLSIWAIDCFLYDYDVLGSIFFCLALTFKQMSLYYAPAIFAYLLGKCFKGEHGFLLFIKLGLTVLVTFGVIFMPFLDSIDHISQVITRVFPLQRGLYEDKVANAWCAMNVIVKLREIFEIQTLTKIRLGITPDKRSLVYGIANSSLAFFMFSFQVHEKSILLPALPITLLLLDEGFWSSWFINVAVFSLFPLLKKEDLALPYFVVWLLWNWVGGFLSHSDIDDHDNNQPLLLRLFFWVSHLTMVFLHIAEFNISPPKQYPDLYVVLNKPLTTIIQKATPTIIPRASLHSSRVYNRVTASSTGKEHLVPTTGTYPRGFKATGLHCGVKKNGKKDLALIFSEAPCTAAAVFTTNVFKAAPVLVSREILEKNPANVRALIVNSGCANAVTGTKGLENARKVSDVVSSLSGTPDSALLMSTGVIGQHIPVEKIIDGARVAFHELGESHKSWLATAEAIMTTDTFPKLRSREFRIPSSGLTYRMAGMSKGAGMIHPNMATLLATVLTDAPVTENVLSSALKYAVDRSFNAISVDGDMSTNDTFAVLANGAAADLSKKGGVIIDNLDSKDFVQFRDDLTDFAAELAQLIVRDGEGATKFVTIHVKGAQSFNDAKQVASTIATSALVKTALFGQDANWGRILCAVGYSGVKSINPSSVSVSFIPTDGTTPLNLLVNGEPELVDEKRASEILAMEDLEIGVDLGGGDHSAKMWTCDFSHEYVTINADYRT
ncbi:14012_t:CDS:10 [Ambispora leptoticha]|uniref:Arginine biosynthesis bifunctional protein ArgJ, mitochondrial n=1 Tax=Ambispora leptoticha TaxID=144679 RepID=A0A9N8V088_9GLOM|nr:14012_t:CDS:10 [Ambispora leptoticha]